MIFADMIRHEFEKKNTIKLQELYHATENIKKFDDHTRKHRVRQVVYKLLIQKEIKRVSPSTYQKI